MRRHLLPILLLAVFSVAIYAPALRNGFVYDDPSTIANNVLIKDFGNLPELFQSDYFVLSAEMSYRPVVTFTYFLDYALYGLRPWGFHLTNILLHAINGIMLYALLTLILRPSGDSPDSMAANQGQSPISRGSEFKRLLANPPFVISILFLTHPVLTEAVNAVSFREDLLAFLFYIATLSIYLMLRQPTSNHRPLTTALFYLLSCITYSLALFSKEMAVSLPLVICCYELIYADGGKGLRPVLLNLRNIGYLAITIAYIYLRFYHLHNPLEVDFGFPEWGVLERVITFPWLFLNYLRLAMFPVSLSVDYMTPPLGSSISISFIVSLAVFVFLLVAALLLMRREKGISFGILFFIITLAPVYNLVPIGHPVPLAERFLYLPAAGFAVVMGLAVSRPSAMAIYPYALFLILAIYIPATAMRSMVWESNYTLWSDTVRKLPRNPFAHYALGLACQRHGKLEEAKEHFQASLRLRPEDPNAGNIYINLGTIYDEQGQLGNAIVAYRAAVRLNPGNLMPHYNLGVAYAAQGRFEEAVQEFNAVLRIEPTFVEARHNLGMAYMEMGIFGNAREEFEAALKLKPDFALSRKAIASIESTIRQNKRKK